MSEENIPPKKDYGKVVHGGTSRMRISMVWIFPFLAAVATGWLFWSHWVSQGPVIQIQFDSAPGLQVNKTLVIYRGVSVGKVTSISLNEDLNKVLVKVQLKANAANLSRAETVFWVDEPEISLFRVSGLDALIQGNSIHARLGGGAPTTHFIGLNKSPLETEASESLILKLHAKKLPGVVRGAPIYYRGVRIGTVRAAHVDTSNEMPFLQVVVNAGFQGLVRSNARFWSAAAAEAEIGPGGLKLDLPGLAALLQGGIEFDYFGDTPGELVKDGADFELFPTKDAARAMSPPIKISFEKGIGLLPGVTQLRYLDMPVGLVVDAKADPATGRVEAIARLDPGYDILRHKDAIFSLVHAKISLTGVSGLDTIVRGVYVDCVPGSEGAGFGHEFVAQPHSEAEFIEEENAEKNAPVAESRLEIVITATTTTTNVGAPVIYRGIQVGKVVRKGLAADGKKIDLFVEIEPMYAPLVRANSKFWDIGGIKATLGFFSVRVQATSITALVDGGIAFATPNEPQMGPRVKRGHQFPLNKAPRQEWLNWAPSNPGEKR